MQALRPAIFPLGMQIQANWSAAAPAAAPEPTPSNGNASVDSADIRWSLPAPSPAPTLPTPAPAPVETPEQMLARVDREIRDMQFATRAASLESSDKALEAWQAANPWNTVKSGLPAAGGFVWALGKSLTSSQRGTMNKLIKAGIPARYARELVERGEGDMIGYMLAHPPRKRK